MMNLGVQYSNTRPQDIEITDKYVFLATNILPYAKTVEDHAIKGFRYECIQYTKDEYIAKLHQDVIDTQLALCDLYETLEG